MAKVTTLANIIGKESAKTVASINKIVNGEPYGDQAAWDKWHMSDISAGVKERLTKGFAKLGLEFTAESLHQLSAKDKKLIADIHNDRVNGQNKVKEQKALKYCAAHYEEVQAWFLDGAKLYYHKWTGSCSHKRLANTSDYTLFKNLIDAFHMTSKYYEQGNDAPRGGRDGDYYAYKGPRLHAVGFLLRLEGV